MKQRIEEALTPFGPVFDGTRLVDFTHAPRGPAAVVIGPSCGQLYCTGRDACDFLNRMTTLSPHRMKDSSHQHGFILEHTGKIKVSFDLYRHNAEAVSLFCAPSELQLLTDTLSMFHFAEDIEFKPMSPRQMLVIPTQTSEVGPKPTNAVDLMDWRGRTGVIARVCPVSELISQLKELFENQSTVGGYDAFERLRIGLGIGHWLHEYTPAVTPLDVNGHGGIVEQKGCYPGQEVIERTLAIGRPARKLALIVGERLHTGHNVFDTSDKKVGIITSVMNYDETSMCGLAIVKGKVDAAQAFYTPEGNATLREIED